MAWGKSLRMDTHKSMARGLPQCKMLNREKTVGAVESLVGARSTFYSTMYPIQCNNDYYSESSG